MRSKQRPRGQVEMHVTCCDLELGEACMLASGERVEILRAGYGEIEQADNRADKWSLHCPECGSHTEVNISKLAVLMGKLRDAYNAGGPRTITINTTRLAVLLSQVARTG